MSDNLSGQLIWAFLVSIIDAALLSWLTLHLYRRSVRRLMRGRAAGPAASPPANVPTVHHVSSPAIAAETSSLQFELTEAAEHDARPLHAPDRPALSRRIAIAYSVGAGLYAAVITLLKLAPSTTPLVPAAWLAEWWTNTWPVVPTLAVLFVLDRRRSLRLAGGYLLAGAAAMVVVTFALQLLRGSFNSAPVTNVFWMLVALAWSAGPVLVLLLSISWRRVRAVMPVALAVTLIFGFGLLVFRQALLEGFNVPLLRDAILNLAALTSVGTSYYALFLLASLPFGWIAWRVLRMLARAFDAKRFSDVQMIVDCWWVIVTAEHVATTLTDAYGIGGAAGGLAAFAAYRGSVWALLRGAKAEEARLPQRLLLLRVFGYQVRTESLFDTVAQRWRFHGPVQLIAGVDLAMRTADPGDVLAFVNGRLADSYVGTLDEIPRRIAKLDLASDPDGRYRINEVYCRDDTWRPALEALLDVSDRVLMDLRSFSGQNTGCIFELEQLVRRVTSDHIVMVCDKTTDLPLLSRIMTEAWDDARGLSLARGTGRIALVKMEGHSAPELGVLMERLLRPAAPTPLLSPSHLRAPA